MSTGSESLRVVSPSAAVDDGVDREAALQRLPESLQTLNRIYIDNIARRALLSAAEAAEWLDQHVAVFLRHDKVSVFAIANDDAVAMADFVTLSDVNFHVDSVGREQSNAGLGPLANTRTIHAFLTGRLTSIGDHGRLPDSEHWEPVIYHPLNQAAFARLESGCEIFTSQMAKLVPGDAKVWCPRSTTMWVSDLSRGGRS